MLHIVVVPFAVCLRFICKPVSAFALVIVFAVFPAYAENLEKTPPPSGSITGTVKSRLAKMPRYPTIVYIEHVPNAKRGKKDDVSIVDQVERLFVPSSIPILAGSTIEFQNNDNTNHDIFCDSFSNPQYGEFKPKESVRKTFDEPGVYHHKCSIHPRMNSYVVVLQNRFFTITDKETAFTITNIPIGTWKLKVWNQRMRKKKREKSFDVTVTEGETTVVELAFR